MILLLKVFSLIICNLKSIANIQSEGIKEFKIFEGWKRPSCNFVANYGKTYYVCKYYVNLYQNELFKDFMNLAKCFWKSYECLL